MDTFVKEIFDLIIKILPTDWGKVVFHIALERNHQSICFFVKDKSSSRYYSFAELQKLGIFSKYEFQKVSMQIGTASREYQKTFEKEWTGYTLVIFRDGKSLLDFEFEQNMEILPCGWEKKYLSDV